MKSTTLSLFSLLIFVFTSPSLSRSILGGDDILYDVYGDPVVEGASYVIGPVGWGLRGGSIQVSAVSENNTCKAYVIQDTGAPATSVGTRFHLRNIYPSHETSLKIGYPVAIQSADNPCKDDTAVWKVTDREDMTKSSKLITLGGQINAEVSCFRFTKAVPQFFTDGRSSYYMEHAPYLCNGPPVARRVGVYEVAGENGIENYLATNDGAEQYVFVPRPSIEMVTN